MTDPRGVLRGRCTTCSCVGYTRTSNEVKCSTCGHPPGKHANLSTGPATAGGAQHSQPSGSYVSPSYAGSGFAAPVHASHYPQLTPPLGLDLPQCPAPGCYNKVHYDSELGPFDYCSPECRDQHLLPTEQEKLKADIAKFSSDISSLPSSVQPSSSLPSSVQPSSSLPSSVQPSDQGGHDVKGFDSNDCVVLKKKNKEDLGIIVTRDVKGGLLITGVDVKSSAFKYFKMESIKFLDVIMEINEEPVTTPDAFRRSVWSKTQPKLKLKRCYNMPSPNKFLTDVEGLCPSVTHIFVLNPQYVGIEHDFGFMPSPGHEGVKALILDPLKCAHQSGVTDNDVIKMYALVHNMSVGTSKTLGAVRTTISTPDHKEFEKDMRSAAREQRPLVLAVQKKAQSRKY